MKKEKMDKEKGEMFNFVQSSNRDVKASNSDAMRKDHTRNVHSSSKRVFKHNRHLVFKCYFCKKAGHMKRSCPKYKAWLAKQEAKKGKKVFSCFDSNLIDIPSSAWWLDSGSSVHVTNSLQDFRTRRIPNKDEVNVSVGNGRRVEVKALGTIRLNLDFGFQLDLENVVCVPSMRRKLVSASRFVLLGFYFTMNNSSYIGTRFLVDGMFPFSLKNNRVIFNTKSKETKSLQSSNLWHKRLWHISKPRMELLVKDEILPPLNFNDFDFCVECIKGKLTKSRKEGST